jgi:hypothetical protein
MIKDYTLEELELIPLVEMTDCSSFKYKKYNERGEIVSDKVYSVFTHNMSAREFINANPRCKIFIYSYNESVSYVETIDIYYNRGYQVSKPNQITIRAIAIPLTDTMYGFEMANHHHKLELKKMSILSTNMVSNRRLLINRL